MKRGLFVLMMALSLLLTTMSLFFWVRSHHWADRVECRLPDMTVTEFVSVRGALQIDGLNVSPLILLHSTVAWWSFHRDTELNDPADEFDGRLWYVFADMPKNPWQTAYLDMPNSRKVNLPGISVTLGYYGLSRTFHPYFSATIAWWWLAAICGLPLWVVGAHRCRRRMRTILRRRRGRCVECGYDLRASGENCPECGRHTAGLSTHRVESVP